MLHKKLFLALSAAFLSIALLSCGSGDEPKAVDEPGAEEGAVGADGDISSSESAEGVCGRSPAMREAILRQLNKSSWLWGGFLGRAPSSLKTCAEVTAEDLSNIKSLNLFDKGLREFKPQELSGMTGLRSVNLNNNELTSFSIDGLDDLPSLRQIDLRRNNFSDEERSRLMNWAKSRGDFQFNF